MSEQSRADSTGADTAGEMTGRRAASAAAQPEDSWDRLAALAFGGPASAGGRSAHAHDYDCTCLAEYGAELSEDPEMEIAD